VINIQPVKNFVAEQDTLYLHSKADKLSD